MQKQFRNTLLKPMFTLLSIGILSLALFLSACDSQSNNQSQQVQCINSNCHIIQNQGAGNTSGSTTSNTPQPTQPNQGPTPTATPVPIATSAPTPTDTPTPVLADSVSKPGDVCKPSSSQFQASGWVAENNSFVFTGNGSNIVIAPCNITTPNYSVTATIMLFKSQLGVGVVAHADNAGQSGYAAGSGCRNISFGRCGFFINDRFTDIMDIDQEAGLSGQTHTYKLVVNGVSLKLYYDNNSIPIVSKSLATYPQAGYAGFECYDQCQVTEFTVTGI